MQELGLNQKLRLKNVLAQRISPQQLQTIKLLQIPSVAMKARIEEELASNPALDEGSEIEEQERHDELIQAEEGLQEYMRSDGYNTYSSGKAHLSHDWQAITHAKLFTPRSLEEQLLEQLSFLSLDECQHKIGTYLIGSIEGDGYLRRDLEAIVNDLAFTQYLETSVQEVGKILKKIQRFDPPGIGARNLQECLLIQLKKKQTDTPARALAIQVIDQCFEAFTKKHYDKVAKKLGVEDLQLLKDALAFIAKLDPRPGDSSDGLSPSKVLYPDFIVTKQHGKLHVALSTYNLPTLRVRKNYVAMLESYHKQKDKKLREAAVFVKTKMEAAQWFIDAMKQREHTLLNTMNAIVKLQPDFFMEEEENNLKPMILKYVAEEIGMDVSTVSRIVNNKSVQTDFSIYPLKFFFTEGISTTSGEDVSNKAVKNAVAEIIANEDKQRPYADEKIAAMLKEEGYHLARRTVAKYREQLHLPVARLRREL